MAQPNGSSSIGGPTWPKTWQTDNDGALRRTVSDNILQLFHKRRGSPVELQQKLPEFVKRLEEALYRSTTTKTFNTNDSLEERIQRLMSLEPEEYADQTTLESRLETLAKRLLIARQRASQHGSQSMSSSLGNMMLPPESTLIPTPGTISASGVVSGMMPTPGSAGTMVPTPETDSLMRLMEELNLGLEDR